MDLLAPRRTQLGGGIEKDKVAAKTHSYTAYFTDDATSSDAKSKTEKRLANYTDVVNSCTCYEWPLALRWACVADPNWSSLALCSRPHSLPLAHFADYDLATSFYEFGWVRDRGRGSERAVSERRHWSQSSPRPVGCHVTLALLSRFTDAPSRHTHTHQSRFTDAPCVLSQGDSFHFAHRYADEALRESIRRHEYHLALKLRLDKSHRVRPSRA